MVYCWVSIRPSDMVARVSRSLVNLRSLIKVRCASWGHQYHTVRAGSCKSTFPANLCFHVQDDLPDLQEVREEEEQTAPPIYQVDMGVSHQERHANVQPPDTHWLTQLAHIATGPRSPLLQECPHSRWVNAQFWTSNVWQPRQWQSGELVSLYHFQLFLGLHLQHQQQFTFLCSASSHSPYQSLVSPKRWLPGPSA